MLTGTAERCCRALSWWPYRRVGLWLLGLCLLGLDLHLIVGGGVGLLPLLLLLLLLLLVLVLVLLLLLLLLLVQLVPVLLPLLEQQLGQLEEVEARQQ